MALTEKERAERMALRIAVQRRGVVRHDQRVEAFADLRDEVQGLAAGTIFGQDAVLRQQVKQQLVAAINVAQIARQCEDPSWIEMSNRMVELVVGKFPQLAVEIASELKDPDLIRQIDGFTESPKETLAHRMH